MLSMVCHNESPILLLNHWIRGLFALYNVLCEARVCLLLLLNLSDKPLGGVEWGWGEGGEGVSVYFPGLHLGKRVDCQLKSSALSCLFNFSYKCWQEMHKETTKVVLRTYGPLR